REGTVRLKKSNPRYDALMLAMDENIAPTVYPIFSEELIGFLHRFLQFPNTGRIDGGLHASPRGSRNGWIHTDLCSGWFDESTPTKTPIRFPNRARCEYFTGHTVHPNARPTAVALAIVSTKEA